MDSVKYDFIITVFCILSILIIRVDSVRKSEERILKKYGIKDYNIVKDDILYFLMENGKANTSKMLYICGHVYTEEEISREVSRLMNAEYIDAQGFAIPGRPYRRYTIRNIKKAGYDYIEKRGVMYWRMKKLSEMFRQKQQSLLPSSSNQS